jgi:hypothetical protein
VDDLLIIARTIAEIQRLKTALSDVFEIKDLGEVSYLLGMQITRNRTQRTLYINQTHYIEELVIALGTGKTADVPVVGYDHLTKAVVDELTIDESVYQSLIRKLNWIARVTRPDIAFVTQKLS